MRRRTRIAASFVVGATVVVAGCATPLTAQQDREYQVFESRGTLVEEKTPGLGAALGILPGGGSFYARAYGWGVVNLLLWPPSILWDPVSGYWGSKAINYYATKDAVQVKIRNEVGTLDDLLVSGTITRDAYVQRKRQIESFYDPTYDGGYADGDVADPGTTIYAQTAAQTTAAQTDPPGATGRRVIVDRDLGATFGPDGRGGLLVTTVAENGPAAKAGIHVGDVVTAVDGQPTAAYRYWGNAAVLIPDGAGKTVELEVVGK